MSGHKETDKKKLRIGKIPYANIFPIFYMLEKECDCSSYEFVEGVPSQLNRMLREGELDLSPSSSVEYLRHPSLYRVIDNQSISSKGPVGSIFLFSKKPIEELDNAAISVTSQSATSVALLDIILRKFYGVRCLLKPSDSPGSSGDEAFLLIGDEALKQQAVGKGGSPGRSPLSTIVHHPAPVTCYPFVYDLGEIWYGKTGLPFVFALWIVRAELYEEERKELFDRFVEDLNRAKERALKSLPEIARHSPMRSFLSEEDILSYWNKLDYELDEEHRKGLELFGKYLNELS